jgi:ATP-binding protein involved in chromosome partitioning
LGIVENMSAFVCEHGTEYDLFGKGGAKKMAEALNLPFLGALPIHPQLRVSGDAGTPASNWDVPGLAKALDGICEALAQQISIASFSGRLVQPTLSVS